MVGSFSNSRMRSASGPATYATLESEILETRDAETAGQRPHTRLRERARFRLCIFDRDEHEIFERLDIVRIDGGFVDLHLRHFAVAVERHFDRSRARAAGHRLRAEFFLDLRELCLQLAR